MDEKKLRQIIREEIGKSFLQIQLHLLAISQAVEAVPWQHIYKFGTEETNFPYRVLLDYREAKPEIPSDEPVP